MLALVIATPFEDDNEGGCDAECDFGLHTLLYDMSFLPGL